MITDLPAPVRGIGLPRRGPTKLAGRRTDRAHPRSRPPERRPIGSPAPVPRAAPGPL